MNKLVERRDRGEYSNSIQVRRGDFCLSDLCRDQKCPPWVTLNTTALFRTQSSLQQLHDSTHQKVCKQVMWNILKKSEISGRSIVLRCPATPHVQGNGRWIWGFCCWQMDEDVLGGGRQDGWTLLLVPPMTVPKKHSLCTRAGQQFNTNPTRLLAARLRRYLTISKSGPSIITITHRCTFVPFLVPFLTGFNTIATKYKISLSILANTANSKNFTQLTRISNVQSSYLSWNCSCWT